MVKTIKVCQSLIEKFLGFRIVGCYRVIDVAESTARGTYAALTLAVRKRWNSGMEWYNRGLQFQAYYTYAENKDDDSNERKFQDIFYQDWQNLAAEFTWSNNDIRHNFVTNATWSLPYFWVT